MCVTSVSRVCHVCAFRGPVFSLKWNSKGDLLLSCSADTTAIIWDATTGDMRQKVKWVTRCNMCVTRYYLCGMACGMIFNCVIYEYAVCVRARACVLDALLSQTNQGRNRSSKKESFFGTLCVCVCGIVCVWY